MKLEASDFESVEDFPLKWRWTDPRWNKLPDENLDRVRPLTITKAAEMNTLSTQFISNIGLLDSSFTVINRFETAADEEATGVWLRARFDDGIQEVIISWDERLAVLTDWSIFQIFWDDFCYPASDNVTIFPITVEWMLFYSHDEYFEFGRMNK